MYSGSSLNDIAAVLGRSVSSVKSKAVSLGLRRSTGQFAPDRAPQIRGRVQGQADMAADYIRSHDRTPVYRCDREGKPNPKAKFWKYGYGSLVRSEEHTSELQSLMRSSYAVFCLKTTTKTADDLAKH